MRSSILICTTCLLVTGCSAQLRFPSLSSALSSLTGFGSGANSGGSSASNGQSSSSSSSSSSPYSGFVRDYGRNLMMAMSSIYPSIFKPPQSQQSAQAPQQQQQQQSPFEQFAASQPLQSLFAAATGGASANSPTGSNSGPSFTFGGSTFSISPSLPFGSLTGASAPAAQQGQQAQGQPQGPGGSHSPFSASFGSSINSPPSFGPLSSAPFFQSAGSMPSFAPASSYSAAFEAANGGNSFGPSSSPGAFHSAGAQGPAASQSYQSLGSVGQFGGQPTFDSSSGSLLSPSMHQPQSMAPPAGSFPGQHSSSFLQGLPPPPPPQAPSVAASQQSPQAAASAPQASQMSQFGGHHHSAQQYRPDMMSIAASVPVPSSNSYSNYGNIPSGPSQQQAGSSSYQQPSYR